MLPFLTPYKETTRKMFQFITPAKEYIMVDEDSSKYTKLNTLNKCTQLEDKTTMCAVHSLYSVAPSEECEIRLFTKANTKIPETCEYQLAKIYAEIFQPLHDNTWIFVLTQELEIQIVCSGMSSIYYRIQGAGTIHL